MFVAFGHPQDKWSPALQIRTVLLSIQAAGALDVQEEGEVARSE